MTYLKGGEVRKEPDLLSSQARKQKQTVKAIKSLLLSLEMVWQAPKLSLPTQVTCNMI